MRLYIDVHRLFLTRTIVATNIIIPNGDAQVEQLDAVEEACSVVRPWTGQIHSKDEIYESVPQAGVAKEGQPTAEEIGEQKKWREGAPWYY